MTARRGLYVLVALLALAVSACGGETLITETAAGQAAGYDYGDTTAQAPQADAAYQADAYEAAPAAQPAAASTVVNVAQSEEYGAYLVDAAGRALYRFDSDAEGVSNCTDDCLAAWPPLPSAGEVQAGEGVDLALLGTIAGSEGSPQVTYKDWPLYYYASDVNPGDTLGQAVGDVWWLVAPDGSKITGEGVAAPATGDVTVSSAYSEEFGTYLTDGEGRPLYRSNADECAISNCSGACAEAWPAVLAEGSLTAGGEVSQDLLATFERSDGGGTQAMVADWPVYTFAQDAAGGPPQGHGANDGQWSLINLDGARKDA